MIKINKKRAAGKWYKYPEDKTVEFFIRPFPYSKTILSLQLAGKDPSESDNFETFKTMFHECLTDWKGILDDEGVALECNTENKEMLLNNSVELTAFIYETASEKDNTIIEELKN